MISSAIASGVSTASGRFLNNNSNTLPLLNNIRGGGADSTTTAATFIAENVIKAVSIMGGASSDPSSSSTKFKLMLLILMVVQNSSVVLIGRHTRSSVPKDQLYIVSHFIVVAEFTKLILSAILEHVNYKPICTSINQHILARPLDFLRISVPALLYLVQNSLLYVALSNLSAPLFQVCYQTKLLTTAVVSVVLLQRRYSAKQWVCLFALGVGVAIVVLGEKAAAASASAETQTIQNLGLGLIAVSIACLSSAFAGVYFEKVLKRPGKDPNPPSLWMRNVQLAFFSVLIGIGQLIQQYHSLDVNEEAKPFCYGFTPWVWFLVMLQAGGGLLVAAIIKYADNVLKGLATGVAVVVSTLCSIVLFDTPLTPQFSAGAVLILGSVYFFSNDFGGSKTVQASAPSQPVADVEAGKNNGGVELKPLIK